MSSPDKERHDRTITNVVNGYFCVGGVPFYYLELQPTHTNNQLDLRTLKARESAIPATLFTR